MTGPPPKPVELRLLEGNPGKRSIPHSMKCRPLLNKKPPTLLGRAGRAEWKRIMDTVGNIPGLIQEQDRPALTALCLTWEQYVAASALVQKAGVLVKSQGRQTDRATAVRNPAMHIARDCLTNLLALWARFGMTPSDRSRLEVPKDNDHSNPLQEIIEASRAEAAARRSKG
jgi:P27 family predicted phage terminase small subunit